MRSMLAAAAAAVGVAAVVVAQRARRAGAEAASKASHGERETDREGDRGEAMLGSLSRRGRQATKPFISYIGQVLEGFGDAYSRVDNPGGIVLACVAENKTVYPLLDKALKNSTGTHPLATGYGPPDGLPPFKAALATVLNHRVVKETTVDPSQLVVAAGDSALMHSLGLAICDPGDGVLSPTPHCALTCWLSCVL